MGRIVGWLGRHFVLPLLCPLLGHPPVTDIAWDGKVAETARRVTREIEARGDHLAVNCVCGRKMVRVGEMPARGQRWHN